MLISSGLIVWQTRERQQTTSIAQSVISSRQVIITNGVVAIYAQTTQSSRLRLSIDALNINMLMSSNDGLTHDALLRDIEPGTYMYTLTLIDGDWEIVSPMYDFHVPKKAP